MDSRARCDRRPREFAHIRQRLKAPRAAIDESADIGAGSDQAFGLLRPDIGDIGASLYDAFAATGHPPTRGLQRLRAVLLSDDDAALLGVPTGSPVLFIQRIAYLADGRGVEFTRSYYRSDTYEFVSEVTPARARAEART